MTVSGLLSVANGNKTSKTRQVPQQNFNAEKTKTWRKNLNLLHGTALGFFFLIDFFSRITSLQSRGLAEKLSQSHGNSRSLQTYYIK